MAFLQKHSFVFPTLRDFLSLPTVRDLVDPHRSAELEKEELHIFLTNIDDLLATWEDERTGQLVEHIRSEIGHTSIPILDLAITNVARCRTPDCKRVFFGLQSKGLTHTCRTFGLFMEFLHARGKHDDNKEVWYDDYLHTRYCSRKWAPSSIQLLSDKLQPVIQLCQKDPLQVTATEMDNLNHRFFCAGEYEATGIRIVLKWRETVTLFLLLFYVIFKTVF